MTDRMDTEALRALADAPKTAIYRDKDGDVCIDDGREWNLVFCPATDEGGSYLCPDVVDEIIARYGAATALAAEVLELRAMRAAVEQTKAEVDAQLKARGMVSVDQLVKPFSPFQIHAGMSDLGFFKEWLARKASEYAQMRAKCEVMNETDDDMYEWLLGNSGAYADVLANFNAATAQGDRA